MLVTDAIGYVRAGLLFFAQITGSLLASGLVVALFPAPFSVNTVLSNGTSLARGFFIEFILTMELVFTASHLIELDTSNKIRSLCLQRKSIKQPSWRLSVLVSRSSFPS
jgi:glycerol uptake facilitator-like aquaporin